MPARSTTPATRVSGRLRSALSLVLLVAAAACRTGSNGPVAPEVTLGATSAAEQAVRPLVRRWMRTPPADRGALEPELTALAQRFPTDPLARTIAALRAWDALERGEVEVASRLARPVLAGAPGTARDLAVLVVGALQRRSGNAPAALATLGPLLHKMVDPPATSLLDEELVRSALAAREWRLALRYMDAWHFEVPPGDRDAVLTAIATLLREVPASEIVDAIRARPRVVAQSPREQRRMSEVLAQHLARHAAAEQDVPLARLLLEEAGALLGGEGDEVARLAGDRARGRVAARTVGVLLAFGSPALRRRSADVVTGMAFGLRVGEFDARLVTRDDGGDPANAERALAELAAEGAAVIVAGVDPRHGRSAATYAERQGLPVLLLTTPPEDPSLRSPRVFVLGEPSDRSVGALARALRSEGARIVGGLGAAWSTEGGAEPKASGLGLEWPCAPLPALDALQRQRVDALVALDGAYCDGDVVDFVRSLRAPMAFGLGALPGVRFPDGSRIASAGIFPVAPDDPRLVGWFESGRPAPTWWMALGRDAAVLSRQAVRDLADAASDDDVRARRVQATSALAASSDELWTSEARGFAADGTLPRTVALRRWTGKGATP